jgi:hypothetical protein
MTNIQYYSVLLFFAGVVIWQLISGTAMGAWWRPRVDRREDPWAYWFFMAAQGVVWIVILMTGRA